MSFVLTIVALTVSGRALLGLLRLATGRAVVDLAFAWFVGSGWFALMAAALRFGGGVAYDRAAAAAIVLAPPLAWGALALATRRRRAAAGEVAPVPAVEPAAPIRWLPRPWWVFAPIAAYVVFVVAVTVLEGFGTPTNTDDGIRVRAFTPLLALADAWGPATAEILSTAGALPTFVPSLAWRLTGAVDPFHPNYVVLADFLAFVVATVALPTVRGGAERGWAGAFAVLSLPLFLYHCTTTYQDAVLAMFVAAAFLWTIEYARTADRADAARALLLLGAAALIKREGRVVAGVAAMPVVAHLLWGLRAGASGGRRKIVAGATAVALVAVAAMAASGPASSVAALALHRLRGFGEGTSPEEVRAAFAYALLDSGNAGMLYWIVPAALVLRIRLLGRRDFWLPFVTGGLVFALVAASALWMYPRFTLDQSTVHRSLIVASLLLSLWVSGVVVEPAGAAGAARARHRP